MSHELTQKADGSFEFAYLKSACLPWHGLGQSVEDGADADTWRAASGLDWKAQRAFVRYATERDQDTTEYSTVSDRVVLFRSDNKRHLGIVSADYKIVQPADVQAFFFDMAEAHGFTVETMGSLFGGRKVWALARAGGESYVVDKRDAVRPYLMLATSLDGSMATEARKTAIQVVCNNTMQLAERSGGNVVKVRHSTVFQPDMVRAELGVEMESELAEYVRRMRVLAQARVPDMAAQAATVALLKGVDVARDPNDKAFRETTNGSPFREIMGRYFSGGRHRGIEGVERTAYGWLNAVTDYVDHAARTRGQEYAADRRAESAWFGKGAETKAKALEYAGAIADEAATHSIVLPAATKVDLNRLFGLPGRAA